MLNSSKVPVAEISGRQHLRSASRRKLTEHSAVSSQHIGSRAFSVAGPADWNSLPDSLRDPAVESERFRRDLKMHLFAGHSDMSALEVSLFHGIALYKVELLTYLLQPPEAEDTTQKHNDFVDVVGHTL